jgi:SH3 domain-containing YSC84-like protein 1
MLVMNDSGMRRLLQSKFTLGAKAGVAAGPVGRTASAETAECRLMLNKYSPRQAR